MHIQAKATPAASPPDLEAFVRVLSEPTQPDPANPTRDPINIEGVTGGNLETGGEFVFAPQHGRETEAVEWLEEAGYTNIRLLDADHGDFFVKLLSGNTPGQLLAAISEATTQNLAAGRLIKYVLIGQQTAAPKKHYVQISFQEVKR